MPCAIKAHECAWNSATCQIVCSRGRVATHTQVCVECFIVCPWSTPAHRFDFIITFACTADLVIDLSPGPDSGLRGTLTTLRLLRIFRLARYWQVGASVSCVGLVVFPSVVDKLQGSYVCSLVLR